MLSLSTDSSTFPPSANLTDPTLNVGICTGPYLVRLSTSMKSAVGASQVPPMTMLLMWMSTKESFSLRRVRVSTFPSRSTASATSLRQPLSHKHTRSMGAPYPFMSVNNRPRFHCSSCCSDHISIGNRSPVSGRTTGRASFAPTGDLATSYSLRSAAISVRVRYIAVKESKVSPPAAAPLYFSNKDSILIPPTALVGRSSSYGSNSSRPCRPRTTVRTFITHFCLPSRCTPSTSHNSTRLLPNELKHTRGFIVNESGSSNSLGATGGTSARASRNDSTIICCSILSTLSGFDMISTRQLFVG
mmetsp:Transcript_10696/g.33919  ORF Transcript_10696/g.33919 Transcript_10696/m.33919 type:complete len:302 (+) Transcript_10696:503-1408(+)